MRIHQKHITDLYILKSTFHSVHIAISINIMYPLTVFGSMDEVSAGIGNTWLMLVNDLITIHSTET